MVFPSSESECVKDYTFHPLWQTIPYLQHFLHAQMN